MTDVKDNLEGVRANLTQAQNQLSGNISQIRSDVGAIRNQQTIYEQSNTQSLARITGQLADKASKTEVNQTADRIREELASLSVGGRNYFLNSAVEISSGKKEIKVHPDFVKHAKGKKFVISVQVSGENVIAANRARFGLSASAGIAGSANRDWPEVWETGTGNVSKKRIYQVFDFKDNWVDFVANLYIQTGAGAVAGYPKLEISTVPTDWSPAPEDANGLITEAKATFERTAQGLRTDLSAVQAYVSADGTRTEALRSYSREETARQLTAERKLIEAGYVAKAQHTEDVRSISRRFEELTVGGRNLALGTSKEWSTPFTNFSGNANVCPPLYKVLTDGLQVGDTLRSKVILKYTDVRPAAGKTATVWLQGNGNVTGWTAGSYNGSPTKTLSGSGEITFEHSFKITENHLKNTYWNWMFRTDFIASGSLQWRLAKVESGSVFTSWSPAPEDATSYADTKLAEYKQSIDGQLSSLQSTLNTTNSSLTNFNSWKQSAQETLNKVGRVESGLNETKTSLAEFKRSAEGQLSTITQQVSGKVSQTELNQRANQITQAVQELSNSVLRKSQVKINEGGIISSVEKTVNGQTLASMIAQSPENVEIIARLLKVKGDMIVDGSVTVDKLNIEGELSALSGKLGRVTSGEIINEYETPYTRGEIRIADNIQITNHNKSGPRSNLGKEEIKMLPNGILMNAYDTNEKPIHTMQVSPDVISYQRLNYSLKGGGTGSWDLAYSSGYSALNIDTVNQKIRLQAESSLMWGVNATFLRIGNLVTVSVTRIICNINEIIENGKARERIPSGFRPISQTHLTLTGNFNTTIDATCIVHLETDGSIRFTNNKKGNRVWTGTVSYTTVDEFPLAGDVPKGKII